MTARILSAWFSGIATLLVYWGAIFALIGLHVLPVINGGVLLSWESVLYGAVLVCWGTTLFLVGRIAFHWNDKALLKVLLIGLFLWLVIEALSSLYLGVFFNAGVAAVVMFLFGVPLIRGISLGTVETGATASRGHMFVSANGPERVVDADDERWVP